MKSLLLSVTLITSFLTMGFISSDSNQNQNSNIEMPVQKDSLLRHVVIFKFKEGTAPSKIKEIEDAFTALPSKIPQIVSYEWGLNNSPEGLEKGFTHCFFLTFKSEKDRAIYLPHPDHKAFGSLLGGLLEDVLVIDYWAR